MAKILIVDDDPGICKTLEALARRNGHDAVYEYSLADGVKKSLAENFDLVFLDVGLPDGNGIDALPQIRETAGRPEVIIMTGAGDPDGAELAIEYGAWDYIQKPISVKNMKLPFLRALKYQSTKISRPDCVNLKLDGIIGTSRRLKNSLDQLALAAASDASVLISGPTGAGKELLARAVHNNSPRGKGNFVVLDCAALPETLVESMLFGHEKGAFTSAEKEREGLIRQADKGTLFLDEIGEMPLSMQKAFLRVLETRRFRPIGAKDESLSDFRVVSSTNRDLDAMVTQKQFRSDLLFRLRSFHIDLPSLKGFSEDIKELSVFHIHRICDHYGEKPKGFSQDFFDVIICYEWPGNIRELVNVMEQTYAAARHDPIIFARHLPKKLRIEVVRKSVAATGPASMPTFMQENETQSADPNFNFNATPLKPLAEMRDAVLSRFEHDYLKTLMVQTGGDIKHACRVSGIKRSRLYELLKRYQIS